MGGTKKGVIIRRSVARDRSSWKNRLSDRYPVFMKFIRSMVALRRASMVCTLALLVAHAAAAQTVAVSNAWVRTPAPSQKNAAVYMDLKSEASAALVAAGSPLAERAELHSVSVEAGVMRMRPLARVELAAGKTVRLQPSGAHVMLVDLKRPLKAGDKVPLVLSVQSSGTSLTTLQIEAEVRDAEPAATHKH
jgi:copper(I)-binding protein